MIEDIIRKLYYQYNYSITDIKKLFNITRSGISFDFLKFELFDIRLDINSKIKYKRYGCGETFVKPEIKIEYNYYLFKNNELETFISNSKSLCKSIKGKLDSLKELNSTFSVMNKVIDFFTLKPEAYFEKKNSSFDINIGKLDEKKIDDRINTDFDLDFSFVIEETDEETQLELYETYSSLYEKIIEFLGKCEIYEVCKNKKSNNNKSISEIYDSTKFVNIEKKDFVDEEFTNLCGVLTNVCELELLITLNKIHKETVNPKKIKTGIKMKTGREIIGLDISVATATATATATAAAGGGGKKKFISDKNSLIEQKGGAENYDSKDLKVIDNDDGRGRRVIYKLQDKGKKNKYIVKTANNEIHRDLERFLTGKKASYTDSLDSLKGLENKHKYYNYGISQYIYEALLYEHLNKQIPDKIDFSKNTDKGKLSILKLKEYGFRSHSLNYQQKKDTDKLDRLDTINKLLQNEFQNGENMNIYLVTNDERETYYNLYSFQEEIYSLLSKEYYNKYCHKVKKHLMDCLSFLFIHYNFVHCDFHGSNTLIKKFRTQSIDSPVDVKFFDFDWSSIMGYSYLKGFSEDKYDKKYSTLGENFFFHYRNRILDFDIVIFNELSFYGMYHLFDYYHVLNRNLTNLTSGDKICYKIYEIFNLKFSAVLGIKKFINDVKLNEIPDNKYTHYYELYSELYFIFKKCIDTVLNYSPDKINLEKEETKNKDNENNAKQSILSVLDIAKKIFILENGNYNFKKMLDYIKYFRDEHWIHQVFTVILIILAIIIYENKAIDSELENYKENYPIKHKYKGVVYENKNDKGITAYEFLKKEYQIQETTYDEMIKKKKKQDIITKKQQIKSLTKTVGKEIVAIL